MNIKPNLCSISGDRRRTAAMTLLKIHCSPGCHLRRGSACPNLAILSVGSHGKQPTAQVKPPHYNRIGCGSTAYFRLPTRGDGIYMYMPWAYLAARGHLDKWDLLS